MLSGLGKVLSYLPGAREVGALILGSEQPCASMTASSRTFASRVTDLYYGISNEDRKAAFKEGSTEGWNAGLLWTRSHDSPARTFDVHNHACKQNAMLWKGDNEGHKYAQLRQEAVKGYTRSFGITARDEQKIYRYVASVHSEMCVQCADSLCTGLRQVPSPLLLLPRILTKTESAHTFTTHLSAYACIQSAFDPPVMCTFKGGKLIGWDVTYIYKHRRSYISALVPVEPGATANIHVPPVL